jgi:transcriptional regulator with XRE-family HTH domain
MDTIKTFRKCNKISQVALAEYLSVTQGFISQVEKGMCPMPDWVISRILENTYNWDTSMLLDQQETPAPEQATPNNSLIEYLQRKIAELESKVDKLTDEKTELLQENAILKYENTMLSPRKGDVDSVEGSSAASAV